MVVRHIEENVVSDMSTDVMVNLIDEAIAAVNRR
jgi:hypothetical protein